MPKPTDKLTLLTVTQASEMLTVSKAAVYRLIEIGQLKHVRITPRTIRIKPEWVREFLESVGHDET